MIEIADSLFVETGFTGVNVGALVTDEALITIDAPTYPNDARYWSATIERLFPGRMRFSVLTDLCPDRVFNARWMRAPIVTHRLSAEKLLLFDKRFPQEFIENLYRRYPDTVREVSISPVQGPAISFSERFDLHTDVYDITFLFKPGPTPGNIWIYIPDAKVLFSGDTVVCGAFPPLSEMVSQAWLNTLESLQSSEFVDCLLVPGRGEVTDASSRYNMIELVSKLQDVVMEHILSEKPKEDLAKKSGDFLHFFAIDDSSYDWVVHEIVAGLERVYDELSDDNSQ